MAAFVQGIAGDQLTIVPVTTEGVFTDGGPTPPGSAAFLRYVALVR
jgi:hypothetical protein